MISYNKQKVNAKTKELRNTKKTQKADQNVVIMLHLYTYADTLVIFEEKVYEICKYIRNAKKSLNSPFRHSEWPNFELFSTDSKALLCMVLGQKKHFQKHLECRKQSAILVPIISALMDRQMKFLPILRDFGGRCPATLRFHRIKEAG